MNHNDLFDYWLAAKTLPDWVRDALEELDHLRDEAVLAQYADHLSLLDEIDTLKVELDDAQCEIEKLHGQLDQSETERLALQDDLAASESLLGAMRDRLKELEKGA